MLRLTGRHAEAVVALFPGLRGEVEPVGGDRVHPPGLAQVVHPPHADRFVLDKHHDIEAGKIFPVCGNTWRMLHDTRFCDYFDFIGDFNKKEETQVAVSCIDDVSAYGPAFSSGDRTRAFLKVQDGCDYSCSFCTIPMA